MKKNCLILSLLFIVGFAAAAQAEWKFSLGTGLGAMNVEGDMGFNVELGGIGPVTFPVELSPSDINDLMKTAVGLGGAATNGKWMIQFSYSMIELEDDAHRTVGADTASADLSFKMSTGELTVGYPFVMNESIILRGFTGFRYIEHELDAEVVANGNTRLDRNIDNSWTDALLGISMDVPLCCDNVWIWNTKLDAGFGGSEDVSYNIISGINWNFSKHWTTGLAAQYHSIKYENGEKGDADWYFYDADESSLSLKIAFIF